MPLHFYIHFHLLTIEQLFLIEI